MTIHVQRLRALLQDALDKIDRLDEDALIKIQPNTYFLGDCCTFLGISGYDGGYVNLTKLDVEPQEEECEIIKLDPSSDKEMTIAVDLCVGDSDDCVITEFELHELCEINDVAVDEVDDTESQWPTFIFTGLERNICKTFSALGLEEWL